MEFELIKDEEINATCEMVIRACKYSNFADFYPSKYFYCTHDEIKEKSENGHFYVVKDGGRIIGCGGIGAYCGSAAESCLFMIFVDPSHQRKGIGKKIVAFLEEDAYARRAFRLEIHAAISAIPFYRKLGYAHKNGDLSYEDGHFNLEKFVNQGQTPTANQPQEKRR